jgi:hypothetical protein
MRLRGTLVALSLVVAGVVVGFFFTRFLHPTPAPIAASNSSDSLAGRPVVDVNFTTVGAIGSGPHPDWVSYLPTTFIQVRAGSVVRVTINQQDSASGMRNPYFALVRGTVNNEMTINGKTMKSIKPDDAAHTFTIPDIGVSVPLLGVPSDAPADAQETVVFEFIAPAPGVYRWQCFVPCGAGTLYGNGGPMQTLGYMAGEMEVS